MNIKSIKTKWQYQEALTQIESLMGAQVGTPEGSRLATLISLVEAYEKKNFSLDARNVKETHIEQLRDPDVAEAYLIGASEDKEPSAMVVAAQKDCK